ncbi:hypothetical protein F4808DRAFT_476529 [Astrocystis sublimbata]|nr:hypothetical protein F4808DRAFT_476529 [Astrocystis sublimbata]
MALLSLNPPFAIVHKLIYDRIFIKPLPRYITSYAFWQHYFRSYSNERAPGHIHRAALGFVRTYAYLIKYESDLRITQDPGLCLIPPDISWEQFSNFASTFADIKNSHVSPRYAFGEIRLTRLNLYAPILLGRSHFQRIDSQYNAYFARFYAPLFFFIGIISVVLSVFQLYITVKQTPGSSIILGTAFWLGVVVIVIFMLKIAKEWRFAIHNHLRLLKKRRVKE